MIITAAVVAAAVIPAVIPTALVMAVVVVTVGVVPVVVRPVIVADTTIVRMPVVVPAARLAAAPVVAGLDAASAIVARFDLASAILRPDMDEAVHVAGCGLRRVERRRFGWSRPARHGHAAEQQREGDHGGREALRLHVLSSSR
ncbi:hypothetical protein AB4Z01_09435 [Inquilinus sp. YAF38]|uniref:hypothetical protein n=1 Tax=Inquilinus sp. YAF38 TaxID=3233084 RepID=UPI003F8E6215